MQARSYSAASAPTSLHTGLLDPTAGGGASWLRHCSQVSELESYRMRDETDGPEAPSDEETSQLATPVLAARLPAASPWMPRREMEELLRRGPSAVAAVIDVARRAQGRGDPLWPIVVLGELRQADAVPAVGLFLGRAEGGLNVAAAEALGKIGPPALPYLVATVAGQDRVRRLAAYGALAMIPTDEAHRCLRDALPRDRALGDVIARALVQQGRPEAVAALAASAVHAPKRMRREFESAIAALVHPPVPPDPAERDWRLRYRRLPALRRRLLAPRRAPRLPPHGRGDGRAPGRAPRPLARRRHHGRLGGTRRLRRRGDADRPARGLGPAARPRRSGSRNALLAGYDSLRRPPHRSAKAPPHRQ